MFASLPRATIPTTPIVVQPMGTIVSSWWLLFVSAEMCLPFVVVLSVVVVVATLGLAGFVSLSRLKVCLIDCVCWFVSFCLLFSF